MAMASVALISIPISRADLYPHGTLETAIEELDVTHLCVRTDVNQKDTITIAAMKNAPGVTEDSPEFPFDYLEIDLEPSAARQLAAEILAAAVRVTRSDPSGARSDPRTVGGHPGRVP
jgi:hypothetical protein